MSVKEYTQERKTELARRLKYNALLWEAAGYQEEAASYRDYADKLAEQEVRAFLYHRARTLYHSACKVLDGSA